jgi:hypothetical protein
LGVSWPPALFFISLGIEIKQKVMTQKEIKQRLEALEKTLLSQLSEGTKRGLEHGIAYEAGWYIGTIKQAIAELQILQGGNK